MTNNSIRWVINLAPLDKLESHGILNPLHTRTRVYCVALLPSSRPDPIQIIGKMLTSATDARKEEDSKSKRKHREKSPGHGSSRQSRGFVRGDEIRVSSMECLLKKKKKEKKIHRTDFESVRPSGHISHKNNLGLDTEYYE